jgi:hypothetical protein
MNCTHAISRAAQAVIAIGLLPGLGWCGDVFHGVPVPDCVCRIPDDYCGKPCPQARESCRSCCCDYAAKPCPRVVRVTCFECDDYAVKCPPRMFCPRPVQKSGR